MNYLDYIRRLEELDKKYIWHPFTQMKDWMDEKPIIITEGRDCFIKDANGRWYLDAVSSLWVNIHGHRRKEIDDAIRSQIEKIAHSTLLGLGNVPSIELAEKLVGLTTSSFNGLSPRLSKVFYSDNGSTAVEVAIKMAFQYWLHKGFERRHSFISLTHGYHGDTVGAMSVGNVDIFHRTFKPLLFKTFTAPSPYCYRCEFRATYPECSLLCLKEMDNLLQTNKEEIAGVVIEPIVQAAGGMIVWPDGYLEGVRALCNKYNVLLIADEVATGFGRTGKMFACEHEKIVPDIICLSKGITNGYLPLAATLTTDEIFGAFLGEFRELKTFFHGHSYTGNPLACAAACASLDIFAADHTIEKMTEKSAIIVDKLVEISELPKVGNVRCRGLMAAVELVKDKSSKNPYPWEDRMGWKVAYKARESGVLLRPLGNVIVIMPPLSICISDLYHLLEVIKESIIAVTG
ncbi:MAG TPA: adenosylmethionine--8-amino-7-oxononanoate transaminase [Dissulfurispiraceae bacterium]|nr:adenosylmethionine--8-amino-7-oxononanoate transaminase [Dissulfurispiraceae bacterium]